jgi:O-antigen/teichoic acid export membrane protein
VLCGATAGSLLLALVGIVLGGSIGTGLVLFTPWIAPSLVQDFCRAILFREGRGRASAMNDGLWLAVSAIALPAAVIWSSTWSLVAAWGVGALSGALLGIAQLRILPSGVVEAVVWWRREASSLGRWLGATAVINTSVGSLISIMFAAILTTSTYGGLRASQSLFAPLTLLVPALALPGLPAVSSALQHSYDHAVWVVRRIGLLTTAATSIYLLVCVLSGDVLGFVFGEQFSRYRWPFQLALGFCFEHRDEAARSRCCERAVP